MASFEIAVQSARVLPTVGMIYMTYDSASPNYDSAHSTDLHKLLAPFSGHAQPTDSMPATRRSGKVPREPRRLTARAKSETMRVARQLGLPPGHRLV